MLLQVRFVEYDALASQLEALKVEVANVLEHVSARKACRLHKAIAAC